MPALFNTSRKTGSSLIAAMLAVLVSGTSCSEDPLVNNPQGKDRVSFDVSVSNKWDIVKTRSAEQGKTVTSERIENSGLWLITTVESNPDTTLFDAPKAETRAKPYAPTDKATGNNDSRLTDFGVYAWTYTGDDWDNAADKSLYIGGDQATNSGGVWSTNPLRFWPGDAYNMKFFAYAPYASENDNPRTISVTDGIPVIKYTTHTDARQQQDLLATELTDAAGNYNQALGLEFRHILTAVNVKASDDLGRTITSVKFSGIKQSGTYTLGQTEPVWNISGNETTISCDELNKSLTGTDKETPADVLTDSENTTFMMIPQELGENAMIEVTFDDGDVLSGKLEGKTWGIGQRVTYLISLESWIYEFEVEELKTKFEYEGTSLKQDLFKVKSYRIKGDSKEEVDYTVEYSTDNGENWSAELPTNMFDENKREITGSNGEYTYCAKVNHQTLSVEDKHTIALKKNGPYGNVNERYNLSNSYGNSTVENTANCYIVNGPGYYSFPLVYGNAIKNASPYQAAYTYKNGQVLGETDALKPYILERFVDHNNVPITSPYIAATNNGVNVPDNAVLIWQDASELVANVQFVNGGSPEAHRITFDVAEATIKQGNAIIAICDASNNILWSWHIWVTDYDPNAQGNLKTFTSNLKNITYELMDCHLGWCNGRTDTYPERSVKVRVTQRKKSKEFFIVQTSHDVVKEPGNHPYYQWGRKDPMLPGKGSGNTDKICYPVNNSYGAVQGPVSIGYSVKNPNLFCQNNDNDPDTEEDWCDAPGTVQEKKTFYNLWNADQDQVNEDEKTYARNMDNTLNSVKSIYDPCPPGFKVPVIDVFSAFIKRGIWTEVKGDMVGNYSASINEGWTFGGTNSDKTFFPISGYRESGDGRMVRVGTEGDCWSAVPFILKGGKGGYGACYMGFFDDKMYSKLGGNRSFGFAVRPVKE